MLFCNLSFWNSDFRNLLDDTELKAFLKKIEL